MLGDNRVLHGARQNVSGDRRTVITLWFHPHYSSQVRPAVAQPLPSRCASTVADGARCLARCQPARVKEQLIAGIHVAFASPLYHS